jgi:hypothetical protein
MRLRVSLCFALLLMTAAARAEDAGDAKAHYQRGVSLYALGDYAGAADEYEKAFAAHADPALLYDAAQAHRRAGHNARALTLYENYVAIFGSRVANRKEVLRKIDELRAALDAEKKASSSPPVETVPMNEHAHAPAPATQPAAPEPAPPPPTASAPPAATASPLVAAAPPAPERRRRTLMWTLIGAGGAVVIGVGLGVGLGLGLSKTVTPTPSFGAIKVQPQ